MQPILTNPYYWLGNNALVQFTGEEIIQWSRKAEYDNKIEFHSVASTEYDLPINRVIRKQKVGEKSFLGLHQCLLLLQSDNHEAGKVAVDYLEEILSDDLLPVYKFALGVFRHPEISPFKEVRRGLLKICLRSVHSNDIEHYIKIFINLDFDVTFSTHPDLGIGRLWR